MLTWWYSRKLLDLLSLAEPTAELICPVLNLHAIPEKVFFRHIRGAMPSMQPLAHESLEVGSLTLASAEILNM